LVLFCGPADRELLSVLNSVAGAVSDGGPFLLVRVLRWREGIRQRNDFVGALMSDNPNYLVCLARAHL